MNLAWSQHHSFYHWIAFNFESKTFIDYDKMPVAAVSQIERTENEMATAKDNGDFQEEDTSIL